MTSPARHLLLGLAGLLASACGGGDGAQLRLDVRTDYVPGVEFTEVVVSYMSPAGEVTQRRVAGRGEDWIDGVVAGSFTDVEFGRLEVRGELRGANGERVASRRIVGVAARQTAMTFVFTRDCAGVECPNAGSIAATECLGGACVPPECTPETPEECPPGCASDADCDELLADCAAMECISRVCWASQLAGACGAGEYCRPESGCEPEGVDAGLEDAGVDAFVSDAGDAGLPDMSFDMATDGDVGADDMSVDDSGADTGADTGADAGGDTGADSGADSGGDTGADSGADAGGDTGVDSGADSGADTGADAGADTGADSGADTGGDTGADSGGDTGPDVGGEDALIRDMGDDAVADTGDDATDGGFSVDATVDAPAQR